MSNNSGYRVNEDGSVTKINSGGSSGENSGGNNSGGSSDNGGCIWFIIIAVIIGIIVAISNSGSSDSDNYAADSAVVEEVVAAEEVVAVEEVYTTPSATYLNVSDDDIYMSADGGSTDITVSSDGDWYIDVDAANWGHLTKYSNSVTLRVDRNNSTSSRTDYFVIKSGNYTRRINITQRGNTSPTADIERIWMDHGVYQNGVQGMKIHVKFTVDNMNGKTIYAYALFYWGDNTTPLHDQYGNNLSFYGYGTPSYDSARFDDFTIFVPYAGLNMQPGQGSVNLSFDISIRTSSGTELDRDNNTQITFSN